MSSLLFILGQLYSWYTTFQLARAFGHNLRDLYRVLDGWIRGTLTYRDREWMERLQRENYRRAFHFFGSRCMYYQTVTNQTYS